MPASDQQTATLLPPPLVVFNVLKRPSFSVRRKLAKTGRRKQAVFNVQILPAALGAARHAFKTQMHPTRAAQLECLPCRRVPLVQDLHFTTHSKCTPRKTHTCRRIKLERPMPINRPHNRAGSREMNQLSQCRRKMRTWDRRLASSLALSSTLTITVRHGTQHHHRPFTRRQPMRNWPCLRHSNLRMPKNKSNCKAQVQTIPWCYPSPNL